MKINPNYQSAIDQIKPDIYRVLVKSCGEHTSKKGTKCVRWVLTIVGGDFNGRPLYLTTPIEGKGAGFLRQFLQSVNETYVDGDFDVDDYINKEVSVRVVDSKALYGDRSYLKILPLRNDDVVDSEAPVELHVASAAN